VKIKHKIKVWGLLLLGVLLVASSLSSIYSFGSHVTAAGNASAAIVPDNVNSFGSVESSHSSIQCKAVIHKPAAVNTEPGASAYLGSVYRFGQGSGIPSSGDAQDTLTAANKGQQMIYVSFEGTDSSNDSLCENSLGFVQSVGTNKSAFYGGHDSGYYLSSTLTRVIYYVSATVNTAQKTIQFTIPKDPNNSGNRAGTYTLSLNDPDNILSNKNYFSSGGGGSTNGTIGSCFEQTGLNDDSLKACIAQAGKATFSDTATILYAGETYTATKWEGNTMTYRLTAPSPGDTKRLASGNVPQLSFSTSNAATDINMDDKGKMSDINDIDKALNDTGDITLNFTNYDINGNETTGTVQAARTNFNVFAAYYPQDDTVHLVFSSASGNEAPYFGTYARADSCPAGSGVSGSCYIITGAGLSGCQTDKPLFNFSSDPHSFSSKNDGIVSANWLMTSKDSCRYVTVKVGVFVMPATTQPPSDPSSTTPTAGDAPEINCSVSLFNPLSWFLCPLATALETVVSGLDNEINNYLNIKPGKSSYSSTCNTSKDQWCGYYNAWSVIRNISLGLIVVFALVAIVSQAMGFEILDAYTLRKVLPRLLVAAIGITLSWPLMMWFINFTDAVGLGVRQLIYAPFTHYKVELGGGGQFVASFFAAGAIVALGFAGLLSFVATAALAAAVAFLVLTLRQMLIVMLIIFSPIAIACYVVPGTEKVWKLWHESFSKGLLMFPMIAAFIAIGRVFAAVNSHGTGSINQIIAFTAYFAPYFLIPFTFRLAGGALSTIGGMVNDKSRGGFDRLKKFRGEKINENMGAIKQGFDRTRLGSHLEAGKHQSIARREAWGSGAVGIGKRGSARYKAALHNSEFGHMAKVAAESIKNNPDAAANDDANKVAQYATSGEDFIRRYMASKPGATRDEAISQLTYTEQAYGASMGSTQMQHTAATAALASNSSTDTVAERATWMRHVVSSGIMTDSQAASLVKQSGSLASSAGFGDLLGAANGTLSDAELLKRASNGFNPANSHRMRKEQARELGQEMFRQADEAATTHGTGSVEFATAVANAAGIHDVLNGMTPDVREAFATELNGNAVAGKYVREHEAEMEATGNGAFLDRRKTWASTAAAAGGGTPGGFPGAGGGGGAPAGGAGGGGGAGGAPSDMRLKRNITALYQTPDGIQLYRFKYLWSDQEYVGVIAQDLLQSHPEVLSQDELGYYRVNYSGLGLRMMTIEEWEVTEAPAQSIS
jgi:hypothetical protein